MGAQKNIYLDYAATAPLSQSTKEYLISLLDMYGNPSTIYSKGQETRNIIEKARESVAEFINAEPNEIYFTSSGSASNILGIKGFFEKNHNYNYYYLPTMHKSIFEYLDQNQYFIPMKVNSDGIINTNYFIDRREIFLQNKFFVAMEYANSEIGTIQNVRKLVPVIRKLGGVVYLDCTASIPTIPLDVKELNVDMVGFSGHKLGGLKGCGVLYVKNGIQLNPMIYGSQEGGLFGGTENFLGIASLGNAIREYDYSFVTTQPRDYILKHIRHGMDNFYLIGSEEHRLANNLFVCFKGIEAETLIMMLDLYDIQVSSGSACSSESLTPSNALTAINIDKNDWNSCIRMTFSCKETFRDLQKIYRRLSESIEKLRDDNKNK